MHRSSNYPARLFVGILLLFGFTSHFSALAQTNGVLQLNGELHRYLERMRTSGFLPDAFLSNQPLSAYDAQKYLDSLEVHRDELTVGDKNWLDLFSGNTPMSGAKKVNDVVPFLFDNGQDVFDLSGEDYSIQVNPLAYVSSGRASLAADGEPDSSRAITNNTRGFRAAGHIGKSIFFETRFETRLEDIVYPAYAKKTAPRLGVIKYYRNQSRYDYFTVTGLVGYRSKHFEVRFGRDQNRWGHGLNLMLLSNFAPVYDQLQIRTSFGPVQYTNVFASFNDQSSLPESFPDQVIPKKFGTFHRLTVKLPARFELDVFETVIAAPDSTKGRFNGYDVAYLNPIIFYRAVEHDRGSPDNVLIGAGLSWLPFPKLFLYGQTLFDEFRFSELRAGDGWWANKWGVLGGFHTTPTPQFDARAEYAQMRPFTYSHYDPAGAYLHNEDLLGLQSGPNSRTLLIDMNYRPTPRLEASFTFTRIERGRNSTDNNIGADAREPNTTRESDYGNELLQGVRQTRLLLESRVGYQMLPRVFVEGGFRYDTTDDAETGVKSYALPFVQLRWGLPFRFERY